MTDQAEDELDRGCKFGNRASSVGSFAEGADFRRIALDRMAMLV